jgi:hypothetical protein
VHQHSLLLLLLLLLPQLPDPDFCFDCINLRWGEGLRPISQRSKRDAHAVCQLLVALHVAFLKSPVRLCADDVVEQLACRHAPNAKK